jgi:hypothetical protein
MRVDVRLVQQHFGGELPYVTTNQKEASLKVAELILSMRDADVDDLEAAMYDAFSPTIIGAQVAKAMSGCTRAATFCLERNARIRQQQRRSKQYQASPTAAQPNESVARDYLTLVPVPAPENAGLDQARPKGYDED